MADGPNPCPKCGGGMELGFVVDHGHGVRVVSSWAPGLPEKSFWTGTKVPARGLLPIGSFRCTGCGFLESYARPEFAAE